MKKKLIASCVMIMTFFLLAGSGKAQPKFSFKLAGGYGTMSTGDFNTIINSVDNRLKDLEGSTLGDFNSIISLLGIFLPIDIDLEDAPALLKKGELKKLNSGPDFEGEFVINLTEKIGIGIGIGYIHRRKDSEASLILGSLFSLDTTLEPSGAAIPVKISGYYFYPIKSRMNLYLKGGIGYYFGKLTYDSKLEGEISIFDIALWERSVDMKDNAFGLNGGIGFEYDAAKNIGLFVEGTARYAKLKDWKGDGISTTVEGQADIISGTLWYCETLNDRTEKYYPSFIVSKNKPSSDTGLYKNIRKAEIDFSGFSLRLGLRIKF